MQGDFEAFYLRHFKAIYRVCYAFMKNAADAEDCTEDAFVKAMSCDISFENERHERSWLTTTAMNICKDKLKHWWRQKVTDLDEATEQIAAEPDEKSEVAEAVMALPVKYKEVVWLHYYEGYGATLDCLSPDTWRAHWNYKDISYYLSSFDRPSEENITEIAQELIAASCK